ncbi:NUDIX domain-containing protein [Anaerovirgula multivorans]|uniref:NUDIX domain-containing protein n=1 Tax=Anaerovirgula multivorans TaxID=312168 RepID=A0A239LD67_9FIRM|nr:NUDIX domain-containing protein [Anaerovirgula multivorans]SNT27783.1 NUDIX domain-containing protein [Anaerovirgula multivorans]
MKRKDWCFRDENSICNFRSVGVLIRNNRILVQCDNNEYALPGGHVAIGETSEKTLIREYREETGADIFCNRLIWIEETFWKWGSRDAHGIAFYYLISLKNDADIPDDSFVSQKDNCNIMLKWVSIEEMKRLTIYPSFIKDKIENISDGIEHFVSLE